MHLTSPLPLPPFQAPCVPKTARPMAAWLDKALPAQGEVPGLRVVEPPVELQYDERFPAKKTL